MGEPIILEGGDEMITIKLPSSFEEVLTPGTGEVIRGQFTVSRKRAIDPFKTIIVSDQETKIEIPIKKRNWTIEVK